MVFLVRIRSIKPEFWRSQDVTGLPVFERLLFIGLWSYVDDNGVGADRVSNVAADLFADDLYVDPTATLRRVSLGLNRLYMDGLIVRFEVSGRPYLFVRNWSSHQVVKNPSRGHQYPLPTAEMLDATPTMRSVYGDSTEGLPLGAGEQGSRGACSEKTLGSSGEPEARAFVRGGSTAADSSSVRDRPAASGDDGDGDVVGFSAVPGGGDGEAGPDGEKVSGVSGNGGKSEGNSEGTSETGSRKKPVRFNYPDDFNAWWSAYPKTKNKSKKNAFTEWKKAVQSVTAEKLLELTEMYAANPGQDDLRFIPDPERWLKGSRWETVADVDADPAASRPSEDPTDPAAWLGLPSAGWSAPWGENAPASAPVDALPVLDADVVPEDGCGDSGPSEPDFWVPTGVPAPSDHTERWA